MNFCNFISNMRHECRFVAFAPVRHRRQERRIGFDQQSIQWDLADDLTFLLRVFLRDRSCHADGKVQGDGFLRGLQTSVEGMEDPGSFHERA